MISIDECPGNHNYDREDAEVMRLAFLGALCRDGREITPHLRTIAKEFADGFIAGKSEFAAFIVAAHGMDPDAVLPSDPNEFALVMALGREADARQ